MIGLGLALGAGAIAWAYSQDKKSGSTAVTESGVQGPSMSGEVIVDTQNGNVATMPREGANTPPDEERAGHTDVIIEMPPMIIERGVQKPATSEQLVYKGKGKTPCNCIKAPCGPCDGATPVIGPTGGKGVGNTGIVPPVLQAVLGKKPKPLNTGIVPPIFGKVGTTSKQPTQTENKPLPKTQTRAIISTKGVTKAEVGDRIQKTALWAGPMVY